MPLLLLQLGAFPEQIAATKAPDCKTGGAFFLDFGRPLERLRWCGVWNRWVGITMSLAVPVRHQSEQVGQRKIAVDRGDPYIKELQRLWKERFPSSPAVRILLPTKSEAEVQADFELQFPQDGIGREQ